MKLSCILSVVVIAIFCCTGIAFSDGWQDKSGKEARDKSQYHQTNRDKKGSSDQRDYRDDKKGNDTGRHDDQKQRHDAGRHEGQNKHQNADRHENRNEHQYADRHDARKARDDYHKHNGYREHPYQSKRHYKYYDHKGHRYAYEGHWRSWEQWNRYAEQHPEIRKHGDYYREEAHLMFRFCEPSNGACFFFSIGK